MRQVIKDRQIVADDWAYAGKDDITTGATRVVLPLADFLGAPAQPGMQLGVRLAPADDVEQLRARLASLQLIVLDFPSSGEGRPYTQARLLRERYGYRGEIRATGAVRIDQVFLLARCGVNAFDLAPGERPELALAELERFSVAYQDLAGGLVHPRRRFAGST